MKHILVIIAITLGIGLSTAQQKSVEQIKHEIEQTYIEFCSQINKQLPIQVDEITQLTAMVFAKWTMHSYYTMDCHVEELTKEEWSDVLNDIRETQKQQITAMINQGQYNFTPYQLYEFLKNTGMKFRFVYKDSAGELIGINKYDYKDFAVK